MLPGLERASDSELGDNTISGLLDAATASAIDARMLCDELAQLLFPRVENSPSEAMQSSVRQILQMLVGGIEAGLGIEQENAVPASWEILCKSGLLREQRLIEFALARTAEEEISRRMSDCRADIFKQIPVQLIDSKDPVLALAARNLLIAESTIEWRTQDSLLSQMPAELLHLLVWRVVAVFQSGAVQGDSNWVQCGNAFLSRHNESRSLAAAASKLAYFMPADLREGINDPARAGLSLFVSGLANEFSLSHDRILRFIGEEPVAPFMLLLRARGEDGSAALSILQYLRGQRIDDERLPELLRQFEAVDIDLARATVLQWRFGIDTSLEVE